MKFDLPPRKFEGNAKPVVEAFSACPYTYGERS
jgi:hypothetical protein